MNFTISIWEARWCRTNPEFFATPPRPGWERRVYEEVIRPLWRRALADLQPDSKGRYDGPTVLSRLEDAIRATTKATLPETQEAFLDVISMPFEPEVAGPAEPGCACPACLEAQVALDGPADAPRAQRLREALIYGLAFHLEHVLKATTALDRRMGAPHIAWRRGKTSYQGGDDDRAA